MAVLLRAIVMLVILVGLPAAWVYYGPLPPQAQGVIDRVVEAARTTIGWEQPTLVEADLIAAPHFDPAVSPVAANEAIGVGSPATEVASPAVALTNSTSNLQEKVAPLLQQLRALGATEYALEKWGNDGQLYRFRCSLPLTESDQLTQHFEAIQSDPSESIQQVLAEVTTWNTARLNRIQFK